MGNKRPEPGGGTQPPSHCNPGSRMLGLWAGPRGHSSFLLRQVWAPLGPSAGVTTGGFSMQLSLPHSLEAGCGEPGVGPARSIRARPGPRRHRMEYFHGTLLVEEGTGTCSVKGRRHVEEQPTCDGRQLGGCLCKIRGCLVHTFWPQPCI